MNATVSAVLWVVRKALTPAADGLLEAWGASKELGTNIKDLNMELLYVKALLKSSHDKQLDGSAMEELLQKLRDLVCDADDVLDELDYFRIQDQLQGTYNAADKHAKGLAHNLFSNAHHTAKAVGKLLACSSTASSGNPREEDTRQRVICGAWPCSKKKIRGNSSSAPNTNQVREEVRGCVGMLGKLITCSSSLPVHDDDSGSSKSFLCGVCKHKAPSQKNHVAEAKRLEFNRVDVSKKMRHIVEELQPMRREVREILGNCIHRTTPDIAQSRITISEDREPKFYGRDLTMKTIIHDITEGKYCCRMLTVLPIVGVGGIGKTTLAQHIYQSQAVQNHFQVTVWRCVSSLRFNPTKLIEEIKGNIRCVEGEEEGTPRELIQQRLKSKRFLLILDDMWENNEDDWKDFLLPFNKSQEMGSMILVTTRLEATAQMVKTTDHSLELRGLDTEEFRKLFQAFAFDAEQSSEDHIVLLETGEKIMKKLKGSPLAAKTVGRLLKGCLDLSHWTRILESKEWEMETGTHDIMPALRLSYDNLPFHLQQCFSCCALFPEDYKFDGKELIHFWIGLGILHSVVGGRTIEDLGQRNLDDLVSFGFFRKDGKEGHFCYTIHDLLHDLASKVASHECLSLHHSHVRSVHIRPSVRHLSIIVDGAHDDDGASDVNFKNELSKPETILMVKNLHSLMVFGQLDDSFESILGNLLRKSNALRVLCLPEMPFLVESMFHNFSAHVHLRYLSLKARSGSEMHLPRALSGFYHLRVLDLEGWNGSLDLPTYISNLEQLCHFLTRHDELHSAISNVGKLKYLQELKKFQVDKESEGFELRQLGHLRELRELGIFNLEKLSTQEEAAEVKLADKIHLQKLTLNWESNIEPDSEALVLESLRPHQCLQYLCIRGHGGPSCPTWLGNQFSVIALKFLHLFDVAWKILPLLGQMSELEELTLEGIPTPSEFGPNDFGVITKHSFRKLKRMTLIDLKTLKIWDVGYTHQFTGLQALVIRDCPELLEICSTENICYPLEQDENIQLLPNLQEFEVKNCPKVSSLPPIPWTHTLCSVKIKNAGSNQHDLNYSKFSSEISLYIKGKQDLQSLDDTVLAFHNLTQLLYLEMTECPPLAEDHLQMLTSLKTLTIKSSSNVFLPSERSDVQWQLPVEYLDIYQCDASGKEVTQLLSHLPKLVNLAIWSCERITRLGLEAEEQKMTAPVSMPSSSAIKVEDTQAADQFQLKAVELKEEEVTAGVVVKQVNKGKRGKKGWLLLPFHLFDSLQELTINSCSNLILMSNPILPSGRKDGGGRGGEGWLQALRSLQTLGIDNCPKFFSAYGTSLVSSPRCLFPSSLQCLTLDLIKDMVTFAPLLNLTSLATLEISGLQDDLRWESLWPLHTLCQLSSLTVQTSPEFFAGYDPIWALQTEQEKLLFSRTSKLRVLTTDDVAGVFSKRICSLLSSTLTSLRLCWVHVKCFTEEQEVALHLLASLQELEFQWFLELQCLPAGLDMLLNLKRLRISHCSVLRSLPKDGFPTSLQELDVSYGNNEEIIQQCKQLQRTIPKIILPRAY